MYKKVTWLEAAEIVEKKRADGKRVGFTNGCFDVLHIGHVTYLEEARQRCDFLVVGLNEDQSITRLKGKTRPVNPFDARAGVLAALRCVDLVVPFGAEPAEQDTPLNLIKTLKPDLLVKGGDYTRETIPGADFVEENGGKVETIALVPNISTTRILEKGAAKE